MDDISFKEEMRERELDNIRDGLKLILELFKDPTLTDIFVSDNGDLSAKRFGKPITDVIKNGKILNLAVSHRTLVLSQIAKYMGLNLDFFLYPVLEATIPVPELKNARITGIFPPWLQAPSFTIRKPPEKIYTLEQYVEADQLGKDQYETICRYIKDKKNIIIAGSTGSGKTTFLNAAIQKKTEYFPSYRFFIVQDVAEIQCNAKYVTPVIIRADQAIKAVQLSLRYTPDCIIFGEIRKGEVMHEMLDAWNTGHPGGLTTIHANSSILAITRIKKLLLDVLNENSLPNLNEYIDLIVYLQRDYKTGIKVSELYEMKKMHSVELESIMSQYAKTHTGER